MKILITLEDELEIENAKDLQRALEERLQKTQLATFGTVEIEDGRVLRDYRNTNRV